MCQECVPVIAGHSLESPKARVRMFEPKVVVGTWAAVASGELVLGIGWPTWRPVTSPAQGSPSGPRRGEIARGGAPDWTRRDYHSAEPEVKVAPASTKALVRNFADRAV